MQVINSRSGQSFPAAAEDGARQLSETLAIALQQRQKAGAVKLRGKYDQLVVEGVLSADEMELAQRSARRKNIDLEDVLIDEFQVKVGAIGEALAAFFQAPYEPYRGDRLKPMDLLKNIRREFAESSGWVPIEETPAGVVALSTDPERLRGSTR
jgi:hypothetical protein